MNIEIFDDPASLIHFILGILTYFFPVLLVVFLFYEFIEFIYRHRKKHPEKLKCFLGDVTEYLLGISFISLVYLYILV